jgi:site-specific DNA-methyltransferase (adenine-specific)
MIETLLQTIPPKKQDWFNRMYTGDAREIIRTLPEGSVDLSFWSPPYFVGKKYEAHLTFSGWQDLLCGVIKEHARVLRAGAFMVVNINDILCFVDPNMPRFQADNISNKKVAISREDILKVKNKHPHANRYELAKLLGCSEQTIQRRLEDNNVRGGKQSSATKVFVVGGLLQQWAETAGLYLYDRRIWHKDPCWANSQWHSNSYRAVDEYEYLYVFYSPGIVKVNRKRIEANEWAEWGSRAVWHIRSVRCNNRHECEFPEMLAERVIRLFSDAGDVVMDPFVGSGTTTAMARKLGRKYIGIDRLARYTALAENRTNGI